MTSAFLTLIKGQGHTTRSKVTDVEVSAFSECFLLCTWLWTKLHQFRCKKSVVVGSFLSHKSILWLCFRPFLFEKPRNFMFFMRFGHRQSFYEKSTGVRRPADKTLTWKNFNFKLFLNHLTDPFHTWYDGIKR